MERLIVPIASQEELEAVGGRELDRTLQELEVALRRVEAAMVAVVDRCDRSGHYLADGHRNVKAWTLANTTCTPADAAARSRCARVLRNVPTVAAEFAAGRVGVGQVRSIARLGANPRCGDQLAESEAVLLEAAQTLEFPDFQVVAERWRQLADADGAHRAHERAHEYRNARLTSVGEEFRFETSHGVLQGAAMRSVFDAFCQAEFDADWAAARAEHGDAACAGDLARSAAQRRADAFTAMVLAAAKTGVGEGQPIEVVVNLVMDHDQFEQYLQSEIDDTPVTIDPAGVRGRRCETTDGILIDPRQAVAAAAIGRVRRIVIDGAGIIVNAGHLRRLFDGALREAIMAIDPVCGWLGCFLRAQICQIDHIEPHSRGGPTNASNSKIECERHNLFKHNNNYRTTRQPNGTITITRPDGTTINPQQPPAQHPDAA